MKILFTITFLALYCLPEITQAQTPVNCQDTLDCESSWLGTTSEQRDAVFEFAEQYKDFIHRARTELSFVTEAVAFAEANGFRPWNDQSSTTPGTRYYEVNRDRTISLIVIGQHSMQNGFHIIGSHIDSPRLELKGRPLYQDSEFALFQTNYHGGIKYQSVDQPAAGIDGPCRQKGPHGSEHFGRSGNR